MFCLNVNKFTFLNAKLEKPHLHKLEDVQLSNAGSLLPSTDALPVLATFCGRDEMSQLRDVEEN